MVLSKKFYHKTTWYEMGLMLIIELNIKMATMSTRRVNEPTQSPVFKSVLIAMMSYRDAWHRIFSKLQV